MKVEEGVGEEVKMDCLLFPLQVVFSSCTDTFGSLITQTFKEAKAPLQIPLKPNLNLALAKFRNL